MQQLDDQATHRASYTAPAYWIDSVELQFDLDPAKTRVLNRMVVRRNLDVPAQPLTLDGEDLNLARVLVDGQGTSFKMDGQQLVLANLPQGAEPFALEIFTTCAPSKNTKLMGLYVSQETFFTQCEAQGFRRITYFLDRPDVMSLFTVTLRADAKQYPVLLSNGNLVEQGVLEDGRHFAKWVDPHKKPCYLFALVAGKLVSREQKIRTRSGTDHVLQVYVRPGDLGKTEHAMNSLMASIAWDEARFGLPLDLERFMIVATSDFNMGAMENKGLNIFNTKYVLASEATATDTDFANVEGVVGHEYFHNWTGNRITCRDWFQLSLKEGLTVFRDQEFTQDLAGSPSARAVKRIEDVRFLRTVQFPEDAGPMAHSVRPDSYLEISNFYTVTIYEKGAEVVRMMQTLSTTDVADPVGRKSFAKGMKLYFERYDGQAVTCDEFVGSIADANPESPLAALLPSFKRWYSQAGTPHVQVQSQYNEAERTYTLTLTQSCTPTAGQQATEPLVIPVQLGLLSPEGKPLALNLQGGTAPTGATTHTVVMHEATHTVTFTGIDAQPVPSLLRNFSAPVILDYAYSEADLLTLLAHDTDAFNRWEAAQRLALQRATSLLTTNAGADALPADILGQDYLDALRAVLRHPQLDAAFKELVLTLPSESYIAEQLEQVDPLRIHTVREAMRLQLALALHSDWVWAWENHACTGGYRPDPVSSGRRALRSMALSMLCTASMTSGDAIWPGKAYQSFKDASNMTDRFAALSALFYSGHELAQPALARFHELFKDEPLVIDKWFALQASAHDHNGQLLASIAQLMQHPDFNIRNPNRARSVIFSYCNANPGAFHRLDAAGYAFWSDRVIELNAINPQVAARLARALDRWSKLVEPQRSAAREAIARVASTATLSNDVREVVSRALGQSS